MKKTFKLVGLDCANCAAKIENLVQKILLISLLRMVTLIQIRMKVK